MDGTSVENCAKTTPLFVLGNLCITFVELGQTKSASVIYNGGWLKREGFIKKWPRGKRLIRLGKGGKFVKLRNRFPGFRPTFNNLNDTIIETTFRRK